MYDAPRGFHLCPHCFNPTDVGEPYCDHCGEFVEGNVPSLTHQRRELPSMPQLMTPLSLETASVVSLEASKPHGFQKSSEERTAIALCLFMGLFGIHRFFLGHLTSATIQFALGAGSVAALFAGTIALLIPACIWLLSDLYLLVGGYLRKLGS